jgi:hypothetical protein
MQVVDADGNVYGDDNLEINDANGKPKTTGGGVTSVGTTGLISGGPITSTGTISTSMSTNKLVGRSTAGTGIMEEITVGSGLTLSGGTLTNTATPTPLGYYGAWQDDITQTAAASNTGYAMIYRITDITPNGISIVSNGTNLTRITFANTGIYNIQFSSQFQNLSNSPQDVTIWLRKNGTDVTGSAGVIGMEARKNPGDPYHTITGWNYVLSIVAGEYYELVWSTTDHTNVKMNFYAAGSPPPSAASVILTVTQQSGIMAGTGITALNGLSGAVQTISTGTTGTDFNVASSGTDHKFNIPTASATNRGALSTTDWSTFNGKQDTLVSGTNIKTINSTSLLGSGNIAISSGLTVGTTAIASGTVGRILFEGTGNVLQEDAALFWDNTNKRLGIGTSTPLDKLNIYTSSGNNSLVLSCNTVNANVISFKNLDATSQGAFLATGATFPGYGTYQPSQVNLIGGAGGVGLRSTNGTNSHIRFYTGNADADFSTEKMRIVSTTGNVLINTTTDAGVKLDVRAQGALSTDLAFRVRNSADTKNIFKIQGDANAALGELTDAGQKTFSVNTYNNPRFVLGTGYSTDTGVISITRRQGGVLTDNTLLLSQNSFADGNQVPYKHQYVNPSSYYGTNVPSYGYNAGFMYFKDSAVIANLQMKLSPDNALNIYSSAALPIETNFVDAFQIYSRDIVAGNAAPHFRTENGNIIKLYQQPTGGAASTFVVGVGTAVTDASTFDGYTLGQIVKALRNTGILA